MLKNPKHEAFCLHYAKTSNATESYKIAYNRNMSDNAAGSSARRLLQNAKIQERLSELCDEMRSEKIAQAAEIQERLTRILRMDELEDVVVNEGIDKGVTEARIVQKKPALKDVIQAGTVLAKMQGTFETKININMTVPIFGGEDELED